MESRNVKIAYWLYFVFIISSIISFLIFLNIPGGRPSYTLICFLIFSSLMPTVVFIIAGVFTFVKLSSIKDDILQKHFIWLRNTFIAILCSIPGFYILFFLLQIFLNGQLGIYIFMILSIAIPAIFFIWFLYRVIKGYIKFIKQEPLF